MFDRLPHHDVVGLDIDETLINGRYSHELLEWCRTTTSQLHVITFRTNSYGAIRDLQEWGYDMDWFTSLTVMPVDLSIRYDKALYWVRLSTYRQDKAIRRGEITARDLINFRADIQEYREWKGKTCHSRSATVLVDDMAVMVLPGCRKYNVEFLQA